MVDSACLTPTVKLLAEAIYEERAFDRLPILADALEDAGCTVADILNHCRQPGEHVRLTGKMKLPASKPSCDSTGNLNGCRMGEGARTPKEPSAHEWLIPVVRWLILARTLAGERPHLAEGRSGSGSLRADGPSSP